jgi:hypothetical protein
MPLAAGLRAGDVSPSPQSSLNDVGTPHQGVLQLKAALGAALAIRSSRISNHYTMQSSSRRTDQGKQGGRRVEPSTA